MTVERTSSAATAEELFPSIDPAKSDNRFAHRKAGARSRSRAIDGAVGEAISSQAVGAGQPPAVWS